MNGIGRSRIKKEIRVGPNKTPFLKGGARNYLLEHGVKILDEGPNSFVIEFTIAPSLKKHALSSWWEVVYQVAGHEPFYVQETKQP